MTKMMQVQLTRSVLEVLEGEEGDKLTSVFLPQGSIGTLMDSHTVDGTVLVNWNWAQVGSTLNHGWEWWVLAKDVIFVGIIEEA